MSWLTDLRRRFDWLRGKREIAHDVDDELSFHLEMRTREYASAGLAETSARERARARFGDGDTYRKELERMDSHHERRRHTSERFRTFTADVKITVRSLGRNPAYPLIATIILALCIGTSTVIFSLVNTILIRPLPYARPVELVNIGIRFPNGAFTTCSIHEVRDWQERLGSLSHISAIDITPFVLLGGEAPEQLWAARITPEFFSLFEIAPVRGRSFEPAEYAQGTGRVALLSHQAWISRWDGDPDIIGTTLPLLDEDIEGEASFRIVGILPEGFRSRDLGEEEVEIWVPLPHQADLYSNRTHRGVSCYARLTPHTTIESAREEMMAVSEAFAGEYPEVYRRGDRIIVGGIVPLRESVIRSAVPLLNIFIAAAVLLLVIGCVNTANLSLARGFERRREAAVRSALGAGRGIIIRQIMTENVLLALVAGGLGIALAVTGLQTLRVVLPPGIPRLDALQIDLPALGFALAIGIAVGLLSGFFPALLTTRTGIITVLREGTGRTGSGRRGARLRSTFVVVETTLAVMLLITAGLFVATLNNFRRVDPGFDTAGVTAAMVRFGPDYDDTQRILFTDELVRRTEALPGVERAGWVLSLPLGAMNWTPRLRIVGREGETEDTSVMAVFATPGYIEAMGMRIERGRNISSGDSRDTEPVLLVSRTLAETCWPGSSPLGEKIRLTSDPSVPAFTIVGVVSDVLQRHLDSEPYAVFYVPYAQAPESNENYLVVRSAPGAPSPVSGVREILADMDPRLPLTGIQTMADRVNNELILNRFYTSVVTVFALFALVLSIGGLYGSMMYTVAQRTDEMGIRLALGARPGDVIRMVLVHGGRLGALGVLLGFLGAAVLSHAIRSLLFGITPINGPLYLVIAAAVMIAALAAGLTPALRAARTDPLIAMRTE